MNSKEEKWSEISFFKKIIKIFVEFPLNLVRDLTTPPFEKEKWKKEFFAAMPVSISLCLSLFFKLFPYYIKFPHFIFIAVYYILAIIFCIYLYKGSYRGSLPKCEWILLLSALIMSMIWIYTVTTILIQMVNDSQYLLPFEISKSFLIMTVLALGNALPDFLIDCTLSTSGYAEMALSGTIGSPVFSLLFGFGLSLIKNFSLAENKEQGFDLLTFTPSTKVILCAMGGIFINLVHYMLIFSLVNYKVKRYVSYAGFCVFFAYLKSIVSVRSAPAPSTQPSTIILFSSFRLLFVSLYCDLIISYRSLQIPCRLFIRSDQMKKLKMPIPSGIKVAITIPIVLFSFRDFVCVLYCDYIISHRSLQIPCRLFFLS